MASKGIKDRVAIIGMGCTKFGEHWDKGAEDVLCDAAYEAYASAGVQPRCTKALANRAPSTCTGRPCCLARAASADTSSGWYTVPHSVAWLRLKAPGLT